MTDDLGPLRPLTPAQQEDFGNRRETAAVVQTRCKSCGAWYETPKSSQAFKEAFFCDCGVYMQFSVPPLSVVTAGPAIDYSDPDARLDTGMKVAEALRRTASWWDKTGRHLMRKDGAKGASAAVSLDPGDPNYIPSGILNGEPWDTLTTRERLVIVKHWHHFNIRKPQTIGD